MARRSRDWNEGLAQDLRDQEFAREFLLAAMDEGVPIQVALGKVIRAMGVKEFAAKVRMAGPNVLRAINPRHNPTQDTLNRLAETVQAQAQPGADRREGWAPRSIAVLSSLSRRQARLWRAGRLEEAHACLQLTPIDPVELTPPGGWLTTQSHEADSATAVTVADTPSPLPGTIRARPRRLPRLRPATARVGGGEPGRGRPL